MNWKTDLKLNDLDGTTQFEITCKRCRHIRTFTQAQIIAADPALERLYIDQVEASLHCPVRTCRGGVKVAMLHEGKSEGFVGGLA